MADDADDAIELGARYGLALDPWQQIVLRSWLGRQSNGKWSATRAGLAVPRQNGKNAVVEVRELFGIVFLGEKWLHSAHEVKTARKAFLRLASFFENEREYPELAELVVPNGVRRANGQEAITLKNGGSVEFVARSKSSGRGFTVDGILLDEAQELTDESLAALLPTKSSSPLGNPQTIYTGTPPGPKVSGEVFTRLRTQGVKGQGSRFSWLEWGAPKDAGLDDRKAWARANPALGIRLGVDEILDERAQMSDEDFGRERLGWWDDEDGGSRAIPADLWHDCLDEKSQPSGPVAFAVDVNVDMTEGRIVAYGHRDDGVGHVEVIDSGTGTAWVIPRLRELVARHSPLWVGVQARGPVGALVPSMVREGIDVHAVSSTDYAAACGGLFDDVVTGRLRHIGQADLTLSVLSMKRRTVGDAYVWDRRDKNTSITAAVAATVARWGYVATVPDKRPDALSLIY